MESVATLLRKRDDLDKRLEDGWRKIDNLDDTDTIEKWEGFWMQLLTEYEAVCDELATRGIRL